MLKHGSGAGGGLPHGQHMVTTVRQTQAVYDISSPSPGNLLAGGWEGRRGVLLLSTPG